jgi:hypothetical protein
MKGVGNTMNAATFRNGLLVLLAAGLAAGPARAADFRAAWADLASADEAKAVRAALALGAAPKEAVAFLKENLSPVKKDAKLLARWFADLDGDEFEKREEAQQKLQHQGKYIKDDLKKAQETAGAEGKKRLQDLLDALDRDEKAAAPPPPPPNLNGKSISVSNVNGKIAITVDGVPLDLTPRMAPAPAGPPRTWVRAARAVGVLEALGTPEARQLLEDLAGGEADALPTAAAKAALQRLGK